VNASDGRRKKQVQNKDRTMTDQTKSRKFSAIFNAPVTQTGEMIEKTTAKGVPYARFQADVGMKGGVVPRTVMAFGDQLAAVRDALEIGKTVDLAVQKDGGTIKLIGFPREKVATAA
jgi:hypothetical protein